MCCTKQSCCINTENTQKNTLQRAYQTVVRLPIVVHQPTFIGMRPRIKKTWNTKKDKKISTIKQDISHLVPKFAGSNPAEAVGFFRAKKILSTPSFAGEVKPSVPRRRFTACKIFLNATWKSGISGKIHRPFLAHIVPPLATRISGETTSGESWNV